MDFFSFKENFKDEKTLEIVEGSPLDVLIKSTQQEVSPMRVGICIITRLPHEVKRIESGFHLPKVTATDRIMVNYFLNKPEFVQYASDLAVRRISTRLDTSGNIQIDKGKQHRFDVIPSEDVENILKKDNPELFYMFVADLADRSDRHVCGLFLYNEKDSRRVNIYDILSREENYREMAASKRNELGEYLRSLSRTQILDFAAFHTFRYLGNATWCQTHKGRRPTNELVQDNQN